MKPCRTCGLPRGCWDATDPLWRPWLDTCPWCTRADINTDKQHARAED